MTLVSYLFWCKRNQKIRGLWKSAILQPFWFLNPFGWTLYAKHFNFTQVCILSATLVTFHSSIAPFHIFLLFVNFPVSDTTYYLDFFPTCGGLSLLSALISTGESTSAPAYIAVSEHPFFTSAWDIQIQIASEPSFFGTWGQQEFLRKISINEDFFTQREHVLTPSEIANLRRFFTSLPAVYSLIDGVAEPETKKRRTSGGTKGKEFQ